VEHDPEVDMRLVIAGVLFIFASGLQAQQASPISRNCRIQIVTFQAMLAQNLLVEIRHSRSRVPEQVQQMPGGIFQFAGVEGQDYEVTITDGQHEFVEHHTISVGASDPFVVIRFEPPDQNPGARVEATIAARQLLVPARATKELGRSEKAFFSGDTRSSIEHLEKAIRIYPDYAEAHNNLGARFIASDQYDKAVTECEKAIALDPNAVKPHQNLGVALALLHRYREAEGSARRAMQLDPNSVHIRYLLGRLLSAQEINTSETVELLHQAATEIPNARILLVQVLLKRGEVDQAVAELREYLKSPNASNKQQVGCWLAHLTRVSGEPHCARGADPPASTP
jgi:thioredoxin-like negative regulator of GroEL